MLQILFMILKILGILLLVILGIILAVLLLVLFVPVRYRADASFEGKPAGGVAVSWLLHLITVRVNYDGSVKALVKVLWFHLFDKTVWPAEEAPIPEETEVAVPAEEIEPVEQVTDVEVAEPVESAEAFKPDKLAEPKPAETTPARPESTESASVKPKAAEPEPTAEEPKAAESTTVMSTEPEKKTETLIEKLAALLQNMTTKISCTYQQICGKVDAGQKKLESVRTFLADHENQMTLRLLWKQLKKLLRHILPRKLSGRVRFGFDDPATTGQILTYVSPFYGLYAKTLKLEPVFDEKVIEGELHVKGHIRVATLLWIVIRVFLNKNFRLLLKKVMAMGKK